MHEPIRNTAASGLPAAGWPCLRSVFFRDGTGVPANALRHVAVYGYRRDFLLKFASLKLGVLEQVEKLEQLRAMERGYRIRVVASVAPSLEVDTPEDLARANEAAKGMR